MQNQPILVCTNNAYAQDDASQSPTKRALSMAKVGGFGRDRTKSNALRTVNGGTRIRHRTPGTTDGTSRRRNIAFMKTKNSRAENNTIIDVVRGEGLNSEYTQATRTGSQGQRTLNSFR